MRLRMSWQKVIWDFNMNKNNIKKLIFNFMYMSASLIFQYDTSYIYIYIAELNGCKRVNMCFRVNNFKQLYFLSVIS